MRLRALILPAFAYVEMWQLGECFDKRPEAQWGRNPWAWHIQAWQSTQCCQLAKITAGQWESSHFKWSEPCERVKYSHWFPYKGQNVSLCRGNKGICCTTSISVLAVREAQLLVQDADSYIWTQWARDDISAPLPKQIRVLQIDSSDVQNQQKGAVKHIPTINIMSVCRY